MSEDPNAEPATETLAPPSEKKPTLVALIGFDSMEPSRYVTEQEAQGVWTAVSALWHPSLLTFTDSIPRLEDVSSPTSPAASEIRVVAEGWSARLPKDYRERCEQAGTILIEDPGDRLALVAKIRNHLDPEGAATIPSGPETDAAALDFMVLGAARWWVRDLTVAMNHADCLDYENLTREALAGASAWQSGDHATAVNRLRAAFELLTQARERYYPVDAHFLDICLLDRSSPANALSDSLAARAHITFLGPAEAIESLAQRNADDMILLRQAIAEGWADVVGGTYAESDESLAPLESILWQFREGGAAYRKHLDQRNVETVARRRFALYPQLPQIARRFGFRFGLHVAFDDGRFPIRDEAKRLWESPEGTSLETLTKPPLGVNQAVSALQIPWRLAATMKDDHVATLPLVHWPDQVAPWFRDFRRISAYSPVLARWVTLNDYFHITDRPYDQLRPECDSYVTPYLTQAVARGESRPISQRAAHAELRARFNACETARAIAVAISSVSPDLESEIPSPAQIERSLETHQFEEVEKALDQIEPIWGATLTRAICGSHQGQRAGYLVLNPLGIARRAAVLLPDAALDLRPEGPLRASQFTDEGVWAVVELPAFGYAWVPRESNMDRPPAAIGQVSARGRVLQNESISVEIDEATGGIRSLRSPSEETARLGQQLVLTGLEGADGSTIPSRMRCDSFEVDYGGPALVQAIAKGSLVNTQDDRPIASFQQRYRLWSGRPQLDLEITLADLDEAWLSRNGRSDPWTHFLACRWAWPDPNSMLRRTCLLSPEVTDVEHPETPDAIDISTRRQRTALLFGGLAYHRRQGTRMLDTLLIAGGESGRRFRLGVALDLEHPFHASTDFLSPAYVVATDAGVPRSGPTGWIFDLDNKAVAVTRLEYTGKSNDGRGWGVVFHLLETSGRAARCRLRVFRDPVWACQTDFNHEPIVDLSVDGSAVLIDLTPHELARVDVTLG